MDPVSAIGAIGKILGLISSLKDLLAGGAQSAITLADIAKVVEGVHAEFFKVVALAEIRTAKNNFENVWLKTITDRTTISKEDLSPGGSLYETYQHIVTYLNKVQMNLNTLDDVFRRYHGSLHLDELTHGFLAFVHGYGLLLHMHAVRAECRRILEGASSLDDPRLKEDTRYALQYLADMENALSFLCTVVTLLIGGPPQVIVKILLGEIAVRRRSMISDVINRGSGNWTPKFYFYREDYSPLSSTPADRRLTVDRPSRLESVYKSHVDENRAQYVSATNDRIKSVTSQEKVSDETRAIRELMEKRLTSQGGTALVMMKRRLPPMVSKRLNSGDLESAPLDEEALTREIERFAWLALGEGNDDEYEHYPAEPSPSAEAISAAMSAAEAFAAST